MKLSPSLLLAALCALGAACSSGGTSGTSSSSGAGGGGGSTSSVTGSGGAGGSTSSATGTGGSGGSTSSATGTGGSGGSTSSATGTGGSGGSTSSATGAGGAGGSTSAATGTGGSGGSTSSATGAGGSTSSSSASSASASSSSASASSSSASASSSSASSASASSSSASSGTGGGCSTPLDCPAPPNECVTATCVNSVCGTSFVASGTPAAVQLAGDCQKKQCDGAGNIASVSDDSDLPDDGISCTNDLCNNGAPSHTPVMAGAVCGAGMVCNGNGACVGCVTAATCPGQDTACQTRTCASNTCGFAYVPSGTPVGQQTPGDCQQIQCNGMGAIVSVDDDADVFDDGKTCTSNVCTAGVPSNPPVPVDTSCSQGSGVVCDGAGSCIQPIVVLRVGDGSAALGPTATPGFIEERDLSGNLVVKPGNPLSLPTAVSGSNQPLTFAGSATSEGGLSRSANGTYVSLAGYAATPGVASVATTTAAATNRIVGRINQALAADTSTRIDTGFSGSNVRAATSFDGSAFWVSGTSSGSTGGVHYIPFGTTGSTQILTAPSNARVVHVFGSQLYGSSGSTPFTDVFTVGSGLPTTAMQTATAFPGMPTANASPYSFALFDLNAAVPGLDTLYVADDRSIAQGGGVQKWTFDGTTWTLAATFSSGIAVGVRGLAAFASGGSVTLVATTSSASANLLVTGVDNGVVPPTFAVIATAPMNTVFRGVALAPH